MNKKYSTVYISKDGIVSSSNHVDLIAAEDELTILDECEYVVCCVICKRNSLVITLEYMKKANNS